ncbi:hypothetical protein [Paenibacillus taichungensis]
MEMVKQVETPQLATEKEQKRRSLKSLSADDVSELLEQGIQEFHNGGTRNRIVVGRGIMVSYVTGASRRNSITACWMSAFAKWCKGYVKDNKRYIKDETGGYIELKD